MKRLAVFIGVLSLSCILIQGKPIDDFIDSYLRQHHPILRTNINNPFYHRSDEYGHLVQFIHRLQEWHRTNPAANACFNGNSVAGLHAIDLPSFHNQFVVSQGSSLSGGSQSGGALGGGSLGGGSFGSGSLGSGSLGSGSFGSGSLGSGSLGGGSFDSGSFGSGSLGGGSLGGGSFGSGSLGGGSFGRGSSGGGHLGGGSLLGGILGGSSQISQGPLLGGILGGSSQSSQAGGFEFGGSQGAISAGGFRGGNLANHEFHHTFQSGSQHSGLVQGGLGSALGEVSEVNQGVQFLPIQLRTSVNNYPSSQGEHTSVVVVPHDVPSPAILQQPGHPHHHLLNLHLL